METNNVQVYHTLYKYIINTLIEPTLIIINTTVSFLWVTVTFGVITGNKIHSLCMHLFFVFFFTYFWKMTQIYAFLTYTLSWKHVFKSFWFIIINIMINYKTSKNLEERWPKIQFLVDRNVTLLLYFQVQTLQKGDMQ